MLFIGEGDGFRGGWGFGGQVIQEFSGCENMFKDRFGTISPWNKAHGSQGIISTETSQVSLGIGEGQSLVLVFFLVISACNKSWRRGIKPRFIIRFKNGFYILFDKEGDEWSNHASPSNLAAFHFLCSSFQGPFIIFIALIWGIEPCEYKISPFRQHVKPQPSSSLMQSSQASDQLFFRAVLLKLQPNKIIHRQTSLPSIWDNSNGCLGSEVESELIERKERRGKWKKRHGILHSLLRNYFKYQTYYHYLISQGFYSILKLKERSQAF